MDRISREIKDFGERVKIDLKINLIDKKMDKNSLIKDFNILIHNAYLGTDKSGIFKARQYSDAIKILQNYPEQYITSLSSIEEWFKKSGKKNPKSIIEKIGDFQKNGYITQAKNALDNPQVRAIMELTRIANIGQAKAKELFMKHNIVTIDDLRAGVAKNAGIINAKQHIGLKFHDDLCLRIPHSEMLEYDKLLQNVCKTISPDLQMSINGSYRRKCQDSGDIDVLVTGPKGKNNELRKLLISSLTKKGIIVETLASGNKKFMGISKLPSSKYHRHIDIIDTDIDEYPFAQLYFTGSGGFNADMRAVALKRGYSLNEYCLSDKKTKIPVSEGVISERIGKSTIVCEEDIFKFLEMDYVLPHERNKTTLSKINK
tara:strand:+ start:674 stop:1792 length:1119 start_codon:yes stop_codon:yes gene_type:complete